VTAGAGDGMPAAPVGSGHLRVSHLDRERMVEVLKAAFVQGRLTKEEFDLRVGQALASRIFAELTALTADLPAGLIRTQQQPKPARVPDRPPVSKVAAASACVITAVATLGLLAGVAFTMLSPAVFTSSTLVVLPPSTHDTAAQAAIVRSDAVLASALRSIEPAMSLPALRSGIQVTSPSSNVVSISAQGETAARSKRTADAVAGSYVAYLDAAAPGGQPQAQVLQPARRATQAPLPARLLIRGGLGALLGALVGVTGALAFAGVWHTVPEPQRHQPTSQHDRELNRPGFGGASTKPGALHRAANPCPLQAGQRCSLGARQGGPGATKHTFSRARPRPRPARTSARSGHDHITDLKMTASVYSASCA
jgi:capsular polysaccharide biosynthesis protein